MGQWLTGGHAERSFARHADQTVHVEIPPHKYQGSSKFYGPIYIFQTYREYLGVEPKMSLSCSKDVCSENVVYPEGGAKQFAFWNRIPSTSQ